MPYKLGLLVCWQGICWKTEIRDTFLLSKRKQMNLIATCFRKLFQEWVFVGYFPQGVGRGVLLLEKLSGRVWESAARWPKLRYPIYDCCDWQSCPELYEGLLLISITKDEKEASSKKHNQFRGYKNTSPIYDQDALNWYPISDQNSWPILFWAAHSLPPRGRGGT